MSEKPNSYTSDQWLCTEDVNNACMYASSTGNSDRVSDLSQKQSCEEQQVLTHTEAGRGLVHLCGEGSEKKKKDRERAADGRLSG